MKEHHGNCLSEEGALTAIANEMHAANQIEIARTLFELKRLKEEWAEDFYAMIKEYVDK